MSDIREKKEETENSSDRDAVRSQPSSQGWPEAAWLDRSAGAGALTEKDEFNDSKAIQENDGRSQTRTTFYVDYSDKHVDHTRYKRLARINDGQYASERSSQNNDAEKRNFVRLACDRLEVSSYHQERTLYIIENIDMTPFASSHKTTEEVTLGVISLVYDQDQTVTPDEDWDIEEWIVYRDEFQDMMESVNMEMGDLWTIRKMAMNRTDYFEPDDV